MTIVLDGTLKTAVQSGSSVTLGGLSWTIGDRLFFVISVYAPYQLSLVSLAGYSLSLVTDGTTTAEVSSSIYNIWVYSAVATSTASSQSVTVQATGSFPDPFVNFIALQNAASGNVDKVVASAYNGGSTPGMVDPGISITASANTQILTINSPGYAEGVTYLNAVLVPGIVGAPVEPFSQMQTSLNGGSTSFAFTSDMTDPVPNSSSIILISLFGTSSSSSSSGSSSSMSGSGGGSSSSSSAAGSSSSSLSLTPLARQCIRLKQPDKLTGENYLAGGLYVSTFLSYDLLLALLPYLPTAGGADTLTFNYIDTLGQSGQKIVNLTFWCSDAGYVFISSDNRRQYLVGCVNPSFFDAYANIVNARNVLNSAIPLAPCNSPIRYDATNLAPNLPRPSTFLVDGVTIPQSSLSGTNLFAPGVIP